jgi:hypothetical protein
LDVPDAKKNDFENDALETAILELTNWVEQCGSGNVADNVRGALTAIDRNEEFIKITLAVLMTPE